MGAAGGKGRYLKELLPTARFGLMYEGILQHVADACKLLSKLHPASPLDSHMYETKFKIFKISKKTKQNKTKQYTRRSFLQGMIFLFPFSPTICVDYNVNFVFNISSLFALTKHSS